MANMAHQREDAWTMLQGCNRCRVTEKLDRALLTTYPLQHNPAGTSFSPSPPGVAGPKPRPRRWCAASRSGTSAHSGQSSEPTVTPPLAALCGMHLAPRSGQAPASLAIALMEGTGYT